MVVGVDVVVGVAVVLLLLLIVRTVVVVVVVVVMVFRRCSHNRYISPGTRYRRTGYDTSRFSTLVCCTY